MKRLIGLTAALAVLSPLAPAPARAEVIDMAAITCGQLLDMDADEAGIVLFWMHGYFSGRDDDTKLDVKGMGKRAKKIGAYCSQNKKITLISAVKEVID